MLFLISMPCFSQNSFVKNKEDVLIKNWTNNLSLAYNQGRYEDVVLYFDSLLDLQGIQIAYASLRKAMYSCKKTLLQRDYSFGIKIFGKQLMNEPWHLMDRGNNEKLFEIVDEPPTPKGGMSKFNKYISKNLKYPPEAKEKNINGLVYVQFTVNKDGSIDGVHVLKGLTLECNLEAERLITNAEPWKPGKLNGTTVYVKIILPIKFENLN